MNENRSGVLLLNLGGPETLEDVRPFLYRLFSDPGIIQIKNPALRRLLAWMISRTRAKKSGNLYRQIGGGSPLRRITENQAAALETFLNAGGTSIRVYVGMLCWKPFIDEAFAKILADGVRRLALLPLFPQYSETTTGACFRRIGELDRRWNLSSKIQMFRVESWYENPLYLDAMARMIRTELERFPAEERKKVHLLYSAHSLPERYVLEGDPYLDETRKCVALINDRLDSSHDFSLAFQSRVGPVKWLTPSTESVLRELARRGVRRILVVPVSFVSDNIETLQELDIAYRKLAMELGITEFRRTEALNTHPKFIEALAGISRQYLQI